MKIEVRAHVFISGRVQGVFFRQDTKLHAEMLDVKGWVRNLADGRVEAVFEGEESAVKNVLKYCRHGPNNAKVENVEVRQENYSGDFFDFRIR
jgi:acylphosphatase